MSKVYVIEVAELGATGAEAGAVNILPTPSLAEYSVVVSAGVSGGPTLQPTTKFVELSADTTCSFTIGPAPGQIGTGSAGLGNCRLQTNERIVRRVPVVLQSVVNGVLMTAVPLAVFTTANV